MTSVTNCLAQARRSKHTRYPIVNGSLDEVLGVVHVKDLVGLVVDDTFDWKSIMRPPRKVPENMPISKLLRHFQATHQLLAFVVDEYGMVIGIVTLENVLEEIIGDVDDEFDSRRYDIVPQGPDQWLIRGSTPIDDVSEVLQMHWDDADVDTFSGLLTSSAERLLQAGDRVTAGRVYGGGPGNTGRSGRANPRDAGRGQRRIRGIACRDASVTRVTKLAHVPLDVAMRLMPRRGGFPAPAGPPATRSDGRSCDVDTGFRCRARRRPA